MISRRRFLQTTTSAVAGLALAPQWTQAAAEPAGKRNAPYSFILLGDLHYDKPEHHDMAWVKADKPNDVSQIENYSRISRDLSPRLLATVRETITELNKNPATRVAFVLQAGDLVEGLCGSEELSVRQNTEALAFVRDAQLGVPWLFTKGNHDITGPGAVAAFGSVFHPFLSEELHALTRGAPAPRSAVSPPPAEKLNSARFTVQFGNAQFVFFDAYEAATSLEWFEHVVALRNPAAEHFFVVVHPPVVPYGARSTWHIFSNEKERARREKFLSLLGDQHALVLGGHIHKYNTLARDAGRGRFAQFALSSVITAADVSPKMELSGLKDYTGDQIRVEPNFSPDTEAARRAVYDAERPFVKNFEYADLPGYAVVTIDGAKVTVKMYSGVSRNLWRTVDLTALARA